MTEALWFVSGMATMLAWVWAARTWRLYREALAMLDEIDKMTPSERDEARKVLGDWVGSARVDKARVSPLGALRYVATKWKHEP